MLIQFFRFFGNVPSCHFIRSLVGCLCLWLGLLSTTRADQTLLVVGDSLSAAYQIPIESGWVTLLQIKSKTEFPSLSVINASIAGDTTANGLQRLPSLLSQYHPNIVILELGGNDGLRGLPLADIEKNLSTLIKLIQASKAKVLLVGIQLPPNYGAAYTKGFAEIYPRLSEKYNLSLIPFFLDEIILNRRLMFEDGIHPRSEAQPLIVEKVWPYVVTALQEKGAR